MDQDEQTNARDDADQHTGTGSRASRIGRHGRRLFEGAGVRARAGYAMAQGRLRDRPRFEQALLIGLWAMAAGLVALFLYLVILVPLTPGIDDLRQASTARPTVILSADGKELGTFEKGLQERVKLSQVSPHVVKALISTEDHRFYDHHGVDFKRIGGALIATLKGDAQGGSTITQQLARNMFPEEIGRARSLNRKMKELITAIKIENTYSKTEILEAYLNTVPFLYNAYGIEMAARTYFGKTAARLDVLESATLVGMLKGTHYYNPVANPERSKTRRNVVLSQMAKHGAFSEARYRALAKRPLRVRFARLNDRSGKDSHFTAYVRKWLLEWAEDNDYDLQLDGLVVHTTLDQELQAAALRAVERQANTLQAIADVEWAYQGMPRSTSTGMYTSMRSEVNPFSYYWSSHQRQLDAFVRESAEYRRAVEDGEAPAAALKRFKGDREFMSTLKSAKSRLEAGFVAMDPNTGEVRAWVGSRSFERDQYDHVVQAARQPGSTFKPIVYAAALESGISPDQTFRDAVQDIKVGGTVWRPTDMSGSSGGMMTMRDGLVFSKNTITAQVMQQVGLQPIMRLAQGMGIRQSKLEEVPSLALGTSPVTLLEMVSTYSTIAAQGDYRKPVFVRRITDREGKIVADFAPEAPQRAMSQDSALNLIDMLRGVVNRGTGGGVRYRFGVSGDVAGKTGTTQNNNDGWFILMHPNLVSGAWVGFNDNRVAMRSSYWGQGGHNALLLVGDFMKSALESGKLDPNALLPGGRTQVQRPVQQPEEEIDELPGDLEFDGGMQEETEVPDPAPIEDDAPEPEPAEPMPPPPMPEIIPPPPTGEDDIDV
ncbi:penicillin-binding protein 1A [Massilia yuzhufengensis]|uniref:Penicillin-binding protein 1A n=1 Tax=Massilia yuzhufengensis TaxID=1164594 RepID=A0A1I1QV80_9BURK|nr:PBP1A family penicillin-binding protein [Massilia yuzhufengensis]SFD26021.1 penicillin-binding protein 1A [Massilia yuzhufengensis]